MISRQHAMNIVSKRGSGGVCVWRKKSDSMDMIKCFETTAILQQLFLFYGVQNDVQFFCFNRGY